MTKQITDFWNVTACSPVEHPNVSEEIIASVFKVEEQENKETAEKKPERKQPTTVAKSRSLGM
jgi:hypothetical protein